MLGGLLCLSGGPVPLDVPSGIITGLNPLCGRDGLAEVGCAYVRPDQGSGQLRIHVRVFMQGHHYATPLKAPHDSVVGHSSNLFVRAEAYPFGTRTSLAHKCLVQGHSITGASGGSAGADAGVGEG